MNSSRKFPKLTIISDGKNTAALLDGAFLGKRIERLEFVADTTSREPRAVIRLVDIDVDSFQLDHGEDAFEEAVRKLAKE